MSMRKSKSVSILIYNARAVIDEKVVSDSWILIKDKKIIKIGKGKIPNISGLRKINAKGYYVSAGFIDLHIHGIADKISKIQARSGTTSFLQGLHAGDFNRFEKQINDPAKTVLKYAGCLGFHLEGPFINKQMAGAQPKQYIKDPDIEAVKTLIKRTGSKIKIITFACELKGADRFIKLLNKNKIVAALGHTDASYEQAGKAVKLGAVYATHTFNRMSGISSRNPGVLAQVIENNDVSAEIICDGHHVHPALIRLLVNNKPIDKIILVTDSVEAMDDRSLKIIAGAYRMENYTIAGSKLTLLQAVKNMVYFTDVTLAQAVKMATSNPASIIGVGNRKGRLKPGFDADIVIFDQKFNCMMTLVEGNIVYKKRVI